MIFNLSSLHLQHFIHLYKYEKKLNIIWIQSQMIIDQPTDASPSNDSKELGILCSGSTSLNIERIS